MPVDTERATIVSPAGTLASTLAGTPDIIELSHGWELCRTSSSAAQTPDALSALRCTWMPAIVPGTVASALRALGEWSWSSTESFDANDWWYRVSFPATPAGDELIELRGLATIADVWLNGEHLVHSDSMHRRYLVPVGTVLRAENELMIRFASLGEAMTVRRPRPRWKSRLIANQSLCWFRTTFLGRMPGWSSSPEGVGPYGGIAILRGAAAAARQTVVQARMNGSDGEVHVTIPRSALAAVTGGETRVAISVADVTEPIDVKPGSGDRVHAVVRVPHPDLWWPGTHGAQPLYAVTLELGGQRIPLANVGFRKIGLRTDGGEFAIIVNGEPIFARGACWSPADVAALGGSESEYRSSLERARDAGMNMIRIGGTMFYEHDVFYDICDELGILVWQDAMFANLDYPASDEAFASECAAEVREQLTRISAHPCLALVCGNSEVQQQAAMLGLERSEWSNDLFERVIPGVMTEVCPDLPYWSSSPSGGVLPFHVDTGDGHYFGYGPYLRPQQDVRASRVRFASETLALANVPDAKMIESLAGGTIGAAHHPAWKAGVPRDNAASWDFEDVRDHYVSEMFGARPLTLRMTDPERYLELGRAASAELMTRTLSEWRRDGSGCAGALIWLYRDLRPGAGWGVIDASGAPKSVYFAVKRVMRPLTVVLNDEGLNGLRLDVVNDGAIAFRGRLSITLYRGETVVAHAGRDIEAPARGTFVALADDLIGRFTDVTYAYKFGPPGHDVVVATLESAGGAYVADAFHYPAGLPATKTPIGLSASIERLDDERCSLVVQTLAPAFDVSIEARGWKLDDNHFHVSPGTPRRVTLKRGPSASRCIDVFALNATEQPRVSSP